MHISPAGEVSRFSLDSAIVRLGRLAIDVVDGARSQQRSAIG
jgi:hypothetical protein